MLGRTIEAKSSLGRGPVVLLFTAGALVLWSVVTWNPHPAIAAILPALLAGGIWCGRPAPVVFSLESDGIVVLGSGKKIFYDSITSITSGRSECRRLERDTLRRPIEISYHDGVLVIPNKFSSSPQELVNYLWENLPVRATRSIPASLADFADDQSAKFGTDRVEVICARQLFSEKWTVGRNRAIAIAIVLTGILWLGLGIYLGLRFKNNDTFAAWVVFGAICAIAAFFVAVALRGVSNRGHAKLVTKHRHACIVLSPTGFALSQDDLQGILRWDQIRDVSIKIPQFLRARRVSGLRLVIDGGEIILLDVYEQSPQELELQIRSRLDRADP